MGLCSGLQAEIQVSDGAVFSSGGSTGQGLFLTSLGFLVPQGTRIVGLRSLSTAGVTLDHFQLIAAALQTLATWPPPHTCSRVESSPQGEQVPFQGSSEKTRSSWDNLPLG